MRTDNLCEKGTSCPLLQSGNCNYVHGQQTTNKPIGEWYEDVENGQVSDASDSKFNIFRGCNEDNEQYKSVLNSAKFTKKRSIKIERSHLAQLIVTNEPLSPTLQ